MNDRSEPEVWTQVPRNVASLIENLLSNKSVITRFIGEVRLLQLQSQNRHCCSEAKENLAATMKLEAERAIAKLRMFGKRGWRRNAVYYSTKEDMMIIRHVLKNSKHKATGITLWKQLAKSLKDRTYWSLKGRFERKIINQLDKYNLTDKEVKYLRESAGHAARRRISKHKHQQHSDDNCSRKSLNIKGKLPSSTNILLLPDNEDVFIGNDKEIANDEEDNDVIWNEMYRRKLCTSSEDEDQEKNEDKICNKNNLTAFSESDNDLSVKNIYKNKRTKNLITVCKNIQTNVIKTFDDEIKRMVNKNEDEVEDDEGMSKDKELKNYKLKQTEIAGNFVREDYHNFVNNYCEMNNKSSSNEEKRLNDKGNAEMSKVKENCKQNNLKRQINKGIENNSNNELYFKSLSNSSTSFKLNFRNNLQPANHYKDNNNHTHVSERKSFTSSLKEDSAHKNRMCIRKLSISSEDENQELNKENMSNNGMYKRKLSTSSEDDGQQLNEENMSNNRLYKRKLNTSFEDENQELNEENMFNKNNLSAIYGEDSKTSVVNISENIRLRNLISLCKRKPTKVRRIFDSKGRFVLNLFEDEDMSIDEDSEQNCSLNQSEYSDGEICNNFDNGDCDRMSQIKKKDSANERKEYTGVKPITGNNKDYNDFEKHDFPKDEVSRNKDNNLNDLFLPLSSEMEQNNQNEESVNRNASKEIANNEEKNIGQISTVDDIKFNYSNVKETEPKRKPKKRVSFSWNLCSYKTFDSNEEWDECEESQTSERDKEICNEELLQKTNVESHTDLKVGDGASKSKSTESSASDMSVNNNTVDTLSSLYFQDLGHLLDSPYNLDTPSVKLVPYEESPYDSDTPSVELVPYEESP